MDFWLIYITYLESPQILLSPPSQDGNYVVEVGREVDIQCLLEPNLYYPRPVTITSYRVDGNEMTMIGIVYVYLFEKVNMVHVPFTDSDENQVDIVRMDFGVEPNATGTYVCRADNAVGSASRTVHVRVIGICNNCKFLKEFQCDHFCTTSVPSGLRSRVHIGFSLPLSERLSNVISPEDVANILKLIEFFAVCS